MSNKILIVDDSDIVLKLHSYILEGAGFQCTGAENGFTAMDHYHRHQHAPDERL